MCILRMLYRLRTRNQRWRIYTPMLIRENRWRAMRYSFDEGLIDLAKGAVVPFEDLLDELCSLVSEDAKALAGALHTLLQDDKLRGQLGNAGRQRVQEHFSASKTGAQLLDFYQRLLGGAPTP